MKRSHRGARRSRRRSGAGHAVLGAGAGLVLGAVVAVALPPGVGAARWAVPVAAAGLGGALASRHAGDFWAALLESLSRGL